MANVFLAMYDKLEKLHECCNYDTEGYDACEKCYRKDLCIALTSVAERLRIMKSSRKAPCTAERSEFGSLAAELDDLFHQLVDM